jgi:hypothetical protein
VLVKRSCIPTIALGSALAGASTWLGLRDRNPCRLHARELRVIGEGQNVSSIGAADAPIGAMWPWEFAVQNGGSGDAIAVAQAGTLLYGAVAGAGSARGRNLGGTSA